MSLGNTELGINFEHIQQKSLAALNPLKTPDRHIMDDADLAGPLFFGFCFGMFLLFASPIYDCVLLSEAKWMTGHSRGGRSLDTSMVSVCWACSAFTFC